MQKSRALFWHSKEGGGHFQHYELPTCCCFGFYKKFCGYAGIWTHIHLSDWFLFLKYLFIGGHPVFGWFFLRIRIGISALGLACLIEFVFAGAGPYPAWSSLDCFRQCLSIPVKLLLNCATPRQSTFHTGGLGQWGSGISNRSTFEPCRRVPMPDTTYQLTW